MLPVRIFLCYPVVLELIYYRTAAIRLINESKTTGGLIKIWTGKQLFEKCHYRLIQQIPVATFSISSFCVTCEGQKKCIDYFVHQEAFRYENHLTTCAKFVLKYPQRRELILTLASPSSALKCLACASSADFVIPYKGNSGY